MLKKWASGAGDNEAPVTNICSSCAAIDLVIGSRNKTGWATHDLLRILTGRHNEGFNQITFLIVHGDGLVSVIKSLFVLTEGYYKEGTGDLWEVKGEIPANGFPMLVNLTPLHFDLNA